MLPWIPAVAHRKAKFSWDGTAMTLVYLAAKEILFVLQACRESFSASSDAAPFYCCKSSYSFTKLHKSQAATETWLVYEGTCTTRTTKILVWSWVMVSELKPSFLKQLVSRPSVFISPKYFQHLQIFGALAVLMLWMVPLYQYHPGHTPTLPNSGRYRLQQPSNP